jgi:hypothetical protein
MENKEKLVNIYLIKNNYTSDGKPRKGGDFYNVYTSEGNIGDINDYTSLTDDLYELEETLKKVDPTFKRSGGIILKKNMRIKNVSMFGEGLNYAMTSQEEAARKAREIEKLKLMNEKRELLAGIKRNDDRLNEIYNEEQYEQLQHVIKLPIVK